MNCHSFFKKNDAAAGVLLDGSVFSQTNMAPMGHFNQSFGIDLNLCSKLLETALLRGGDFADLYFEHTLGNWLMLEDGRVNQSYGLVNIGVGIRTVYARYGDTSGAMTSGADYEINDIGELTGIVGELTGGAS